MEICAEVQHICSNYLAGRSAWPIGGVPYSQSLEEQPRAWPTV